MSGSVFFSILPSLISVVNMRLYRIFAADRPPLVLVGTVSRLIAESSIRARSGLADVVLMFDGMVAGKESEALRLGRSACIVLRKSLFGPKC